MRQAKRVAIYARGSTGDQTTHNQLRELRAVAERAGCPWSRSLLITPSGGVQGRDKRLAFATRHDDGSDGPQVASREGVCKAACRIHPRRLEFVSCMRSLFVTLITPQVTERRVRTTPLSPRPRKAVFVLSDPGHRVPARSIVVARTTEAVGFLYIWGWGIVALEVARA